MTTKKEILERIKLIADHQDFIATKQNTELKAEAITTHKLLDEIIRELQSIKNILEDAAKEPVKEDKPLADIFEDMDKTMKESDLFSEPAEEDMWIDSKEARKLLGWQTISTSMLKAAGIGYQQPLGKHHKITAHKGDIENYIANRR